MATPSSGGIGRTSDETMLEGASEAGLKFETGKSMEQERKPAIRGVWIRGTMHWPRTDEEFDERIRALKDDIANRTPSPRSL